MYIFKTFCIFTIKRVSGILLWLWSDRLGIYGRDGVNSPFPPPVDMWNHCRKRFTKKKKDRKTEEVVSHTF